MSGAKVTQPIVSVIVVSYNTKEMTLECLRTLKAETKSAYELIVVDNASADGSADAIAAEFPEAILLAETDNHGFAKANNIAAKIATGEFLLLLNPDTLILDGAVDKLLEYANRNPDAKIWGGRTLYADHSLNPTNCWQRISFWSLTSQALGLSSMFRRSSFFNPEGYGSWDREGDREVDIVTGCFFLTPTSFWHQLGGFDLTYVMYGEEADLCLRARAHGARPRITSSSEIIHYGGASETVRADKMVRLLKAKMTLTKRHLRPMGGSVGTALLSLWPLSRMIGTWALRRKASYQIWREIWARRAEWRHGYQTQDQAQG